MEKQPQLAERIPLEGTINTRDLGGYRAAENRIIRHRRVIRTDNLSHLTPKDIVYCQKVLDAHFDIDLRSKSEIAGQQDKAIPGCQLILCPITDDLNNGTPAHPHEEFIVDRPNVQGIIDYLFTIDPHGDALTAMEKSYRDFIRTPFGIEHYRIFLHVLLQNRNGCVLFHCADGKDRAGVAAALFLSALGVSRADVISDYLATNCYTQKKADAVEQYLRNDAHLKDETVIASVKAIAGVRTNWIEAALNEIDTRFGGMDAYLTGPMALSASDLISLRDNYLI